ncbi:myocardin-related transcription factor B [Kryptolebias marmoratus]|uniref:Myocardin related transcription factor Bb n=1 Tax=Kryptolebias marmoratus TaxID=37003 RepID=A0A3Q3GPE4_KRYMA|nr:myocardin-related transcription factor B [Kryptolebias marmoratus]
MGLQIWPPSKPVLSSMACLSVESPSICRGKFKSVLQRCLQQRRTREQLVEQGIMPPLKTPTAFHKQIRSLERARTGNFLKHKLCSRPDHSELVRMHILEEAQAEPALQAAQMKLKRARLANDLNEKISQRPGPMELVEKKILPVDSGVESFGNVGEADNSEAPRVPDVYSFDEDSSDASSPQQEQQSPCSTSPKESRRTEASSSSSDSSTATQLSPTLSSPLSSPSTSDVVSLNSTTKLKSNQQGRPPAVPGISSGPVLVKQSLAKVPADKSRSKKSKEPKPRVKKLKYHQYVPPDQKQELSEVPMDSSYARLLQQQQQFLHLQILSQQQQQYNHQAVLPVTLNISTTEVQTSCSAVVLRGNTPSSPVLLHHVNTNRKPDHLPANLDEMKVAELKMELKLRSLPVSGTKTDLIERLKLYQESSNFQRAATMETALQSENIKFSPPVSFIASEVSKLGIEDGYKTDCSAKVASDTPVGGIQRKNSSLEECPTKTKSNQKDTEKDQRLHEKERQIEELMKKLQQEQKLVEELKMQLEVEKRSQQSDSPPQLNPLVPVQVKEETGTVSACSVSCSSPVLPGLVKQEEPAENHATTPKQFIIAHQTITQAETLQCVKAGAQILLPTCLPALAVAVDLPAKGIHLQTPASSTAPGHIQTSGQVPQKADISAARQQQPRTQTQQLTKTWTMNIKAQNLLSLFPETRCDGASSSQAAPNKKMPSSSGQSSVISQPTKFTNCGSKSKDPPRYEDAVKQTRSMLTTAQGPSAASQQMDDLFDVLIESGEMSPFTRQNPPRLEKPLPVTASVTTLPINTVLSRPPPLVQVAQLPVAPLNPSTDLAPLTSGNKLETLLDGSLVADAAAQKLKLMEEINSPVVTMDVNFSENMPPSDANLPNATADSMDWLDLTLSVPAEGINPLDMSVPEGVFSSDFLDSHELQLNWD